MPRTSPRPRWGSSQERRKRSTLEPILRQFYRGRHCWEGSLRKIAPLACCTARRHCDANDQSSNADRSQNDLPTGIESNPAAAYPSRASNTSKHERNGIDGGYAPANSIALPTAHASRMRVQTRRVGADPSCGSRADATMFRPSIGCFVRCRGRLNAGILSTTRCFFVRDAAVKPRHGGPAQPEASAFQQSLRQLGDFADGI